MSATLPLSALFFITSAAFAAGFGPLMDVTHATWPERNHLGVVCDYRMSRTQVLALAEAAGPGSRITVVDVQRHDQLATAARLLKQHDAKVLVLIPGDRVTGDGSFGAGQLVRNLAASGLPSLATTRVGLRQGAVFSVGAGTGNQLMVNDGLIGTIDVILPNRALIGGRAEFSPEPRRMARIEVLRSE